jgi:N-carbamoylputrescine amidase
MRAALVVHCVVANRDANLHTIVRQAQLAADAGADLVLFSEAALTGFVNNGDPAHDLPLGEPIPGPAIDTLAQVARSRHICVALGLYEREGDHLYDAAVLLAPDGTVRLKYRRIDPHWHMPDVDPAVYRQGVEVPVAETPFGTCAFLLCGDLFNEALVQRVRQRRPNWLLFPFARRFDSEVADAAQWEQEELARYARQAARTGAATLMVNSLADSPATGACFGASAAISPDGTVLSSQPPGRCGTLLCDL